ncbi:hypothetical protein H920_19437 [Fukomys damarensis]|uniref:Uncharacterized protein n=1 Tax=Fukomys damarensis TaxID=885580 RepID=A0A091CKG2_FUKDA|nr:hypothetical protein H920_19437 [Fukomys damarensis]
MPAPRRNLEGTSIRLLSQSVKGSGPVEQTETLTPKPLFRRPHTSSCRGETDNDDSKALRLVGTDPLSGYRTCAGPQGAHCTRGIKRKRRRLVAAAPGGGEASPGPARSTISGSLRW